MKNKFLWITIFVALVSISLSFFLFTDKNKTSENVAVNAKQVYESCVKNFSVELCGMYSIERRAKLYQVCSSLVVPITERDTTLYIDNKLVVVRWRDDVSQEDVIAYLPYEPETNFEGCSKSVKELFGHIQETGPR